MIGNFSILNYLTSNHISIQAINFVYSTSKLGTFHFSVEFVWFGLIIFQIFPLFNKSGQYTRLNRMNSIITTYLEIVSTNIPLRFILYLHRECAIAYSAMAVKIIIMQTVIQISINEM